MPIQIPSKFTSLEDYKSFLKGELQNNKSSIRMIAKNINVPNRTLATHVKTLGLTEFARYKKPEIISDYFKKIDTERKAYLLGFILGDSYLSGKSFETTVALIDQEIIDLFCKEVGSHKAIDLTYDKKTKRFPRARTSVGSPPFLAHLKTLFGGLGKTSRRIPIIAAQRKRDLLRGFFDAEGCITYGVRKNGNNWHKVSFTSSLSLLQGVQKLLTNFGISSALRPKSGNNCYVLEFSDKAGIIKLYEVLYNGASDYLSRKFIKYTQWYSTFATKSDEFGESIAIPSEAGGTPPERVETTGVVKST